METRQAIKYGSLYQHWAQVVNHLGTLEWRESCQDYFRYLMLVGQIGIPGRGASAETLESVILLADTVDTC